MKMVNIHPITTNLIKKFKLSFSNLKGTAFLMKKRIKLKINIACCTWRPIP